MKLHRGFTLIELLVVIAVIGLLTAILIPALAVAKERSRRVVCAKNVNQFVIGCLMYADDFDEDQPSGKFDFFNGDDEHTPLIGREVGNAMVDILGDHKAMKCPWLNEPFDGDEWWYYDEYGYVLGYNYLGGHEGTPWSKTGPVTKEWKSPQFNTDSSSFVLVSELNFWVPNDRTFAPHGSRARSINIMNPTQAEVCPPKRPVRSAAMSACSTVRLRGKRWTKWKFTAVRACTSAMPSGKSKPIFY